MNKLRLLCFSLFGLYSISLNAQDYHTYLKVDVGNRGIGTLGLANVVSTLGNVLVKKNVFDNYLFINQYDIFEHEMPVDISPETTNVGNELFDIVYGGIKIGYQSYTMNRFNWAVYGSAHYRKHVFETTLPNHLLFQEHKLNYALLGIGIVGFFGEISSPARTQLECAIRYELPIYYKGPNGDGTPFLNSGFSYFLAAKFGRPTGYVNFGFFADIPCYNMFKEGGEYFKSPDIKIKSYGLIISLNLWRVIHGSEK